MRSILLALGMAVLAAAFVNASDVGKSKASMPLGAVTVTPVKLENGNTRIPISVPYSSGSWVLLSSAADNATVHPTRGSTVTVGNWSERTIVNCSTVGYLTLAPNNTDYGAASSTFSVVLATGTDGIGGSYTVNDQAEIWGRWDGSHTGGVGKPLAGACGEQLFYLERGRQNP